VENRTTQHGTQGLAISLCLRHDEDSLMLIGEAEHLVRTDRTRITPARKKDDKVFIGLKVTLPSEGSYDIGVDDRA